MKSDRRQFLRRAGFALVAVHTAGALQFLAPAAAHASGDYRFETFSQSERATLAALGEVLLPGCVEEGLCEYLDYQLGLPDSDCLLMLRYLNVPPPFAHFYQAGLASVEALARAMYDKDFIGLPREQQEALVREISQSQPTAWQGPPAPLFYFALRSDAVDVYYGTEAGFERLGVPYMAHIEPPTPW